jgi:4-amino-4-deoxy-L-arabinose transferase-like glycosyltransferase
MKERIVTLPEIGLIAATRGMLGAGIGLLLSGKLKKDQRRAVGWTLVAVGAVTTIPLLMTVLGKDHKLPKMLRAA